MNLTKMVIADELRMVHTILIGRVAKADNANQTVDVEVLTDRVFRSADGRVARRIGTLPDVPLATFRTDRAGDFVEMEAGDLVLVLFSMHSVAEVVASDGDCGPIAPHLTHNHSLSDGFAIPLSLRNRPATSAGATREIISDDIQLGRPNASSAVVLSGLQSTLNNLIADINLAGAAWAAGGAYTVGGVNIPTSQHVKVS